MVHLCFSEELQQISARHELHDDVHGIVVHTHSQHLHNVGVVKVPVGWEREGREGGKERGREEGERKEWGEEVWQGEEERRGKRMKEGEIKSMAWSGS